MSAPARAEHRVLVVAPTPRDAELTTVVLGHAGIEAVSCGTWHSLLPALEEGAGTLLIAEESVFDGARWHLVEWLTRQPPWSDLPVLLVARKGADSDAVAAAMETFGNVAVLERPTRVSTLVSTVRAALRARQRQYQLRRHIDEQAQSSAALRDADRRKDEFLAVLAHELRNPLSAVRTAVATAALDPARRDEALAIARRQTEQLGWIVDDLLDVARITQGRIVLRREPLRLASVIERAVESVRPFIESRRHRFTIAEGAEPLWVNADGTRLEQVLVNLLSNATKYTDPGGAISLTIKRAHANAVVRVRDTGVGIAPELLARVFDLFAQADRSLDRAQGGLGIGLTVTRRLVELHGGCIEAASAGLGCGSEFVVTLPLVAAPAVPDVSPGPDAVAGRAARVLVVEDNVDAAEALQMLLEVLGHRGRVVHDGLAALDAARRIRPDVMLVDIGLPGIDGYEVARRVRSAPDLRTILLVALTGYGQADDRERAMAAGFDRHLVKPVDPDGLDTLLRVHASRGAHPT